MSGATQQKKKEGRKGKRKGTPASRSAEDGRSAGSAAAGHSVGARAGLGDAHAKGGAGQGDDSPPGSGTFDTRDAG